ncbi:MAG: serine/threonine-protein kinase, partial [Acidimicrobiales bacterium]
MTDLGIPGLRAAVEIGRGASSIVYRAEQPKLGRTVAVKVLTAGPADDATRRRFSRECRALGALSGHANIVTLYDGDWPEGGAPYLLMTHLSRGSLEDRLRRDGPLPWWEAAEIGVKLAGALEAAHRMGVLHCDVKPSNVLISDFGEPQLADFGIAQIAEPHAAPARSAQASGTPLYAPPEAFDGTAPAPARDVYSLAATIHALIAGRPPVRIERAADLDELVAQLRQTPPADLRPLGVPEQLARALERALAKAPEHRPQTATLFAESLRHALAAEQRSTAAWSPPAPAGPPSGSTPAWGGDDESPTVVVATPRGGPPAAPAWADAGDAP